MGRMLFIRLEGPNGQVEAAASIYSDGKELPPGLWSVTHSIGETEVMSQYEMPDHWREQVKRWGQWAERELD